MQCLRKYYFLMVLLLFLKLSKQGNLFVSIKSYRDELRGNAIKFDNLSLINGTIKGCFLFAQKMEKFRFGVMAKAQQGVAKPWLLFNVTLSGCNLLGSGKKPPILIVDMVLKAIKQTNPRMPDRCPIKKNFYYCFDKINLGATQFYRNFPQMKAMVVTVFMYKNMPIYTGYTDVDIAKREGK
ncbi:uncharacterized protein LOC131803144 [Musca domestica]|uniref:Uncharacterized protein LOC131803144 n=1 Tax=Musca domestica TaxID=7370 RepID=A0ABM3V345_MUSDO|nr:uncharacterized protein LOC131803144 [Musca domestica]